MDKVSSHCGYVINSGIVDGSVKHSVLRFDPENDNKLKYVAAMQLPPQVRLDDEKQELEFIHQDTFEVFDLDVNLKNLYVLTILKGKSNSSKLYLKLFCLADFRHCKLRQEFLLPIPSDSFDSKNIYTIHGPFVCYSDHDKVLFFGKDGLISAQYNVEKFHLLKTVLMYNKHLMHDQIILLGTVARNPHDANAQMRDVDYECLSIAVNNENFEVKTQPTKLIPSMYATATTALHLLSMAEDEDGVLCGEAIIATSYKQLLYFKSRKVAEALELSFDGTSNLVEFQSSSGCKLLLVTSTASACCIVNLDNFEIVWTLAGLPERWVALADDFISRGHRQTLLLRAPSGRSPRGKANPVVTIIEDLEGDDDEDDSDIIDVDAGKEAQSWKYIVYDFSGITFSRNISNEEMKIFNFGDVDVNNYDDHIGDDQEDCIPDMVWEALDRKYNEAFLTLEETRRNKYTKMAAIKELHHSLAEKLSSARSKSDISHDLVNLLDDSKHGLRVKLVDDGSNEISRMSLSHDDDIEIVGEIWQGVYMNKWIIAVQIVNNSRSRKMFGFAMTCLIRSRQMSAKSVESCAFELKGTERKISKTDVILDYVVNKMKSGRSEEGKPKRKENEVDYLCSRGYFPATCPLPYTDECFVVCSQDLPVFLDTREIICDVFLLWNEATDSTQKNAWNVVGDNFLGDPQFSRNKIKHIDSLKLTCETLEKLMVDIKTLSSRTEFLSLVYSVFISAMSSVKIEIRSTTCYSILDVLVALLLNDLRFLFVQQCRFFWCEVTTSYLNNCAIFITKTSSTCLEITTFYRNASQLSFLVDKLYESFSGYAELNVPATFKRNELIEKIYERLQRERCLVQESNRVVLAEHPEPMQCEGVDNENDDLVKARKKFEKKRKHAETLSAEKRGGSVCVTENVIEFVRGTDRALSLLTSTI